MTRHGFVEANAAEPPLTPLPPLRQLMNDAQTLQLHGSIPPNWTAQQEQSSIVSYFQRTNERLKCCAGLCCAVSVKAITTRGDIFRRPRYIRYIPTAITNQLLYIRSRNKQAELGRRISK